MRRQNWSALRAIRPRRYRGRLRRSGSELLELGLVLGLILLPIMFGTIEFGTYFYVEHNLQSAAREGARAACVYPQSDAAAQYSAAAGAIQELLTRSSLWNWSGFKNNMVFNCESVLDPNHSTPPDLQYYVRVNVSITWDKIPDGMRPMRMITNPQNVTLKGVASMRVER